MAIAHFNVAIVGRSSGKSSVHAAAYASRMDLVDERTGTTYRYARKHGDVVTSWVFLPKNTPEHLRDRAALWNAVERVENRKNSQLARRIILALPHELTPEQREHVLKDFVRENFMRKGLAADVSIHKPDPRGDDRNHHAHILIPTRFLGKEGIGKKDRASNEREAMIAWRDDWEKKVNKQLERHGHETRISMKSLQAQGIDRTPQIHLGQGASALDRKGISTERAEQLRGITANDHAQLKPTAINLEGPTLHKVTSVDASALHPGLANDNQASRTVGKEVEHEQETEFIDRDTQTAAWQDSVDAAGIAHAEQKRQAFLASQATERENFERQAQAMGQRHAESWAGTLERHAAELIGDQQPGTLGEAAEATTTGFMFFLSLFTSWAESLTHSASGSHRPQRQERQEKTKKKDREQAQRRDDERKQRQQIELEAMLATQAREREQFDRKRDELQREQQRARGYFEQQIADRSSLQTEFRVQNDYGQSYRETMTAWEKQRITPDRGKATGPERDGPELGG